MVACTLACAVPPNAQSQNCQRSHYQSHTVIGQSHQSYHGLCNPSEHRTVQIRVRQIIDKHNYVVARQKIIPQNLVWTKPILVSHIPAKPYPIDTVVERQCRKIPVMRLSPNSSSSHIALLSPSLCALPSPGVAPTMSATQSQ